MNEWTWAAHTYEWMWVRECSIPFTVRFDPYSMDYKRALLSHTLMHDWEGEPCTVPTHHYIVIPIWNGGWKREEEKYYTERRASEKTHMMREAFCRTRIWYRAAEWILLLSRPLYSSVWHHLRVISRILLVASLGNSAWQECRTFQELLRSSQQRLSASLSGLFKCVNFGHHILLLLVLQIRLLRSMEQRERFFFSFR